MSTPTWASSWPIEPAGCSVPPRIVPVTRPVEPVGLGRVEVRADRDQHDVVAVGQVEAERDVRLLLVLGRQRRQREVLHAGVEAVVGEGRDVLVDRHRSVPELR